MDEPVEPVAFEIEYIHQIIETGEDGGIRTWLASFRAALDRSYFDKCERILHVARSSECFSRSRVFRLNLIHNEGLLRLFQGRTEQAEKYFKDGLKLCREMGDHYNEAQLLINLGEVNRLRGRWQAALEFYEASERQHSQESDNSRGLAQVQNDMGLALMSLGRWSEAEQAFQRSLSSFQRLEDWVEVARVIHNLGRLFSERGEWDRAMGALQNALAQFRQLGDEYGQTSVLNTLGALYRRRGEQAQARTCYESSLELAWKIGDHGTVAQVLNNLGELHRTAGELDKALEFYRQSFQICQTLGEKPDLATVIGNIGLVAAGKGEWNEAVKWHQNSLQLKVELGDLEGQAVTLNNLGVAYEQLGSVTEAVLSFRTAVSLFRQVGNVVDAAAVLINLSQPPAGEMLSVGERKRCLKEALALLSQTQATERHQLATQLLIELEMGPN